MKFKKPIEVEAGISDGDPLFPLGQSGYLLSSDGSNVNWVSPGGLSAETAEAIVQPIKANEALTKGDPVYIVGYQLGQDVNIVAKADSSDVAKMPVVGLADDDYANQAFGTMTAFGSFNGAFDTSGGTEGWSVGDIIFVKPLGGLTNIKPGGTDLIQNVAIVSRVSTQTGELEVIALGRTNDVPNLPTGRLFVGTAANTSLTSDVVYVDDANDRVGINTATPLYDLDVDGGFRATSTSYFSTDGPTSIAQLGGGSTTLSQFNITTTASGSSFIAATNTLSIKANNTTAIKIDNAGNVGIGTTGPGSKLEVAGEIDATTGDGYKINGKPWANENANILKLGDWDGEGFSTSIFDENSSEIFKVKDRGVIINCDRTSTTSYGADASLVVGGNKSSPWGAGVVTLLNNDPTSQAGDSTGLIQFAIRDDQSTIAGYTSAIISGSIFTNAGTGNPGGGILDFKTSPAAAGSSPQTRMRINQSGNVGIRTTVLTSISSSSSTLSLGSASATTSGGIAFQVSGGVVKAYNYVASNYLINQTVSGIGQIFYGAGSERMRIHNTTGNVGIGTTGPQSRLQVNGGVQLAFDGSTPSLAKVGTFRYRKSGNNSYVDMCMQTGASTYAWVNIVQNNW